MQVSRDDILDTVAPTWGTLLTATVVTLVVMAVQWETRTVSRGAPYAFTDYHYYWPLYTYTHTDNVVPPNTFALMGNFMAGVAICYLPSTLLFAGLQWLRSVVPLSVPTPDWRVSEAMRLRPRLVFYTVIFAIAGSLIPFGFGISLYTAPGLIPAFFVGVGMNVLLAPLWNPISGDFLWAIAVPSAFPFWYGIFGVIEAAIKYVREY